MGFFPVFGIRDHLSVDEIPEDHSLSGVVIGNTVFDFHQEIGIENHGGFKEFVLFILQEFFFVGVHDLGGAKTEF